MRDIEQLLKAEGEFLLVGGPLDGRRVCLCPWQRVYRPLSKGRSVGAHQRRPLSLGPSGSCRLFLWEGERAADALRTTKVIAFGIQKGVERLFQNLYDDLIEVVLD